MWAKLEARLEPGAVPLTLWKAEEYRWIQEATETLPCHACSSRGHHSWKTQTELGSSLLSPLHAVYRTSPWDALLEHLSVAGTEDYNCLLFCSEVLSAFVSRLCQVMATDSSFQLHQGYA